MAWENIDNVKSATAAASCPVDGVAVRARALNFKGKRPARWIEITIGQALARDLRLPSDRGECNVRLLFGTGADAGRIAISADQAGGRFAARKTRRGDWRISIGATAAGGLFSLAFEPFTRAGLEATRPENGQPPMVAFKASDAMLAGDD